MKPEEQLLLTIMGIAVVLALLIDLSILVVYLIHQRQVRAVGGPPLFSPRWSIFDVWIGAHALMIGMVPISIIAVIVAMIFYGPQAAEMKGGSMMVVLALGMAGQTAL